MHGVRVFTQILIDQDEPSHIVNIASLASYVGIGEHSPYCASKAACLSISQSLYSELIAAKLAFQLFAQAWSLPTSIARGAIAPPIISRGATAWGTTKTAVPTIGAISILVNLPGGDLG
jgi:NAD(P)-dependent dehydrogenase (short-subunit alcohol dehydrogenase family)